MKKRTRVILIVLAVVVAVCIFGVIKAARDVSKEKAASWGAFATGTASDYTNFSFETDEKEPSYEGKYVSDEQYELKIKKTDSEYSVTIDLYRLTSIWGTGMLDGDDLFFAGEDPEGNTYDIKVRRKNENSITLTVVHSTSSYIPSGKVFTFYRESDIEQIEINEMLERIDGFWVDVKNAKELGYSNDYQFEFYSFDNGEVISGYYPGGFSSMGNVYSVEQMGSEFVLWTNKPAGYDEFSGEPIEETNYVLQFTLDDEMMIFKGMDSAFVRASDEYDIISANVAIQGYKDMEKQEDHYYQTTEPAVGMTKNEVKRIWGEPSGTSKVTTADGIDETWYYKRNGKTIGVYFYDNELTMIVET